jgi:hypothetical protein
MSENEMCFVYLLIEVLKKPLHAINRLDCLVEQEIQDNLTFQFDASG